MWFDKQADYDRLRNPKITTTNDTNDTNAPLRHPKTTTTTAPFSPSFESHRLRKPTGGLISPSWDPLALTRAALQSSSKNAGHHTGHQKRPRQRVSATVKLLISLETGVNLGPSVGTSGSPEHQNLPQTTIKPSKYSSIYFHRTAFGTALSGLAAK